MQRIKEIQQSLRQLWENVSQLKAGLSELQAALPAVNQFANEVKRDVDKWRFKTQPRLNRIQIILDVLKIDQQKSKK